MFCTRRGLAHEGNGAAVPTLGAQLTKVRIGAWSPFVGPAWQATLEGMSSVPDSSDCTPITPLHQLC